MLIKIQSQEHSDSLILEYDAKGYHMASDCAIRRWFLVSDDGFYSLHPCYDVFI